MRHFLTRFLTSTPIVTLIFPLPLFCLSCIENEADDVALASTLEALAELPPANKDTLAFLILHLQKVGQSCNTNKMPLTSLAKIFGPTIVGHASPNPPDRIILQDTEKQPKVMMKLLGISDDYWRQYMSDGENTEQERMAGSSSPGPHVLPRSPSSAYSPSPGPFRSPATPEPRPGEY